MPGWEPFRFWTKVTRLDRGWCDADLQVLRSACKTKGHAVASHSPSAQMLQSVPCTQRGTALTAITPPPSVKAVHVAPLHRDGTDGWHWAAWAAGWPGWAWLAKALPCTCRVGDVL